MIYDFVMDLVEELAAKFNTTPDVIQRIRSTYFIYKSRIAIEKTLAFKVAKDVKHKSPSYSSREKTLIFLRNLNQADFVKVVVGPKMDNRFGGVHACLLDLVKGGWMKTNQPPTLREFLDFHKKWREIRINLGDKNKDHELAKIEQYELFQDAVEKQLKESFNKIATWQGVLPGFILKLKTWVNTYL